jgi:hypothetical protein
LNEAQRVAERDDEDLAIEQLPGAGRADDPALAGSWALAAELPQERAAARAEPAPPASVSPARLRELRQRIEQLQAQLQGLPLRELQRIEDLDERVRRQSIKREQLAGQLAQLPLRTRRFGREKHPHPIERAHLVSALRAHDRALDDLLAERSNLAGELGDPAEMRAERDGLEGAITQSTQEHSAIRDALAERELHSPGPWARGTFGERPDEPWAREEWEANVRQVAGYRVQHDITDTSDPLGPRPETGDQQHAWDQASEAIQQGERRLGRHVATQCDVDLGIGF